MNNKVYGSFILSLLLAIVFFTIGRMTAQSRPSVNQKTLDNLTTAMHGEAFASAKYLLYAKQARRSGNKDLALLFDRTGNTERFEHFAEEAQLAGLVGSDIDNLKDALKGESYEVETMYREFAQEAAAAGDSAAAHRFEEIRQDEIGHRNAFQAALAKLESKTAANK